MKRCFKCGIEKDMSEFYVHRQMRDGLLNKCKQCTKRDSRLRFNAKIQEPEWAEREKERGRLKFHRLGYGSKYNQTGEQKLRVMTKYKENYPEKAASRLNFKTPAGYNAHHWSYRTEHKKDVIFLRKEDHYLLHRFIKYDKQRFFYRSKEGVVLDTKQKHLNYLYQVLRLNGVTTDFVFPDKPPND